MDFVRTIISSDSLAGIINIPDQLKHRLVEILILPCEEQVNAVDKQESKKARGALSKYRNIELIDKEGQAFEEAMVSKHANS